MLVLTRKINETIVIGGNIRVTMTSIRNRQVRLAIEAPPEVLVMREELVATPPDDAADPEPSPRRPCRVLREMPSRSRGGRPCR